MAGRRLEAESHGEPEDRGQQHDRPFDGPRAPTPGVRAVSCLLFPTGGKRVTTRSRLIIKPKLAQN